MKLRGLLTSAIGAALALAAPALAQSTPTLAPNQTVGFGADRLLTFTYPQNFHCLHQNTDDLNYNGVAAQSDPAEFQTPICQPGEQPAFDPTGAPIKNTAILFVLVPMFNVGGPDTNPSDAIVCDQAFPAGTLCGPELGNQLITLFGTIPEAFKNTPAVFTQCPNPGSPPGTCTMHTARLDLGKVLVALGKATTATNVFVPEVNHSHVIANNRINTEKPRWWEVQPVLVTDANDWPAEDGSSGITSVARLQAAEKAGEATAVPSNFFLFFHSMPMAHMGKTQK
jgi:hypothetical protein